MTQDMFPRHWLNNSLLDEGFIAQKAQELLQSQAQKPLAFDFEAWLEQHFQPANLAAGNEAQLEDGFIRPLLAQLGWIAVTQQSFVVQGKLAKPDWCLLQDHGQNNALIASKDHSLITAICESKAWDKALDNGKANKDNPHHQLQDYLSTLRVRFGFLTNGRIWRVYDTDKITAKKTYLEFDLELIFALQDAVEKTKALALFVFFFGKNTYQKPIESGQASAIEQAIAASNDFTLEVEENLKAVIYGFAGEESLFEIMGKAIKAANPKASLDSVYENSVILLFRLLFVVYFEDKNSALLAIHPFYNRYSLETLYQNLRQHGQTNPERDTLHDGIYALKQLFEMLDEGAEDIDIPLFNGGLFDPARAALLLTPKIFNNATLRQLLEKLLYKTSRGDTLFDTRRDFKNMSVTHLGRIYEGLLEFRFEKAAQNHSYIEYVSGATKGKAVEAYFDSYDAANLRKEKGFRALRELSVKKGEVFLKSANNSRKTSASYYTPSSLSTRLVKASVDQALASGKSLIDLKILDNACGSGHFLVEALGYLTDLALEKLETDHALQALVQSESDKIAEQLVFLGLTYEPDDAQIIKRTLLKRCIFGVDLNPFAVELARLSLWMDSFIFGTPLSLIEHHVQTGNALLGSTRQEFDNYHKAGGEGAQDSLFADNLSSTFDELNNFVEQLDQLNDTTTMEITRSKAIYRDSIAPRLAKLGRAMSLLTARRVLAAENTAQSLQHLVLLQDSPQLREQLLGSYSVAVDLETLNADTLRLAMPPALALIESYHQQYHFFHYEVAFPEAFAAGRLGFDIIVGNPPWDKTKFSDTDFFPHYHSNYRSLKNSEKAAVQKRLLESAHIAAAYETAKRDMEVADDCYTAASPLNKGAGDGNLFRLFVERNLGLLNAGGSLNYVLPSALMFEEGSTVLRKHIFKHCWMPFFYSFENNKGIFPDVHRSYKFALMQLINSAPSTPQANVIDTAFYVLDPAELDDAARHVPYPLATLKALSPKHWSLMELRDAADLQILQKCYGAFESLSEKWLDFRRELHMTDDKALFIEKSAPGLLPLFEGKMVWQYSHVFDTPQYWLEPQAFDASLQSKELYRMAQDLAVPKSETEQHASIVRYDREFVRLGFRTIARDTDERTLIFALLPKNCGLGHSMFANAAKTYLVDAGGQGGVHAVSPLRLLFALGWFNSLPMDWLARQMIQINVSLTYVYRLPIPQPIDAEILSNTDYAQLAKNALLLSLAASWDDFAELAPLFNVQPKDVPQMAKAQDMLRAQNDKLVAKLYGITDAELAHLLKSFPGMANKRPEYVALLQ